MFKIRFEIYHECLKNRERWFWANSVVPEQTAPEEQSDQVIHCLSVASPKTEIKRQDDFYDMLKHV